MLIAPSSYLFLPACWLACSSPLPEDWSTFSVFLRWVCLLLPCVFMCLPRRSFFSPPTNLTFLTSPWIWGEVMYIPCLIVIIG